MNARFKKYSQLMANLRNESVGQRLEQVNGFFNDFKYKREITDYWKCTPEFLSDGCGDCDDFAVSKYFVLLKLNIKKENLKLAYANIIINNIKEAHMVILYKHSKKLTIILDNYDKKIHRLDNRKNLEIQYTFDKKYVYFHGKKYVNKMKKWIAVQEREEQNTIQDSHNFKDEFSYDNNRQESDNTRLSPDN